MRILDELKKWWANQGFVNRFAMLFSVCTVLLSYLLLILMLYDIKPIGWLSKVPTLYSVLANIIGLIAYGSMFAIGELTCSSGNSSFLCNSVMQSFIYIIFYAILGYLIGLPVALIIDKIRKMSNAKKSN